MPTVNLTSEQRMIARIEALEAQVRTLARRTLPGLRVEADSGAYAEITSDSGGVHIRVVDSGGAVVHDLSAA